MMGWHHLPDGHYAVLDPDDPTVMTYWRKRRSRFAPWPPKARYGPPTPPRGGINGIWNVFSGQTATALLALLQQLPETEAWLAEWAARPTIAEALAEGGEAGQTALDWRDRISAEIGSFAVWRGA